MDNFQLRPQNQIQPQFQQQTLPARSFGPSVQPYLPPTNHRKRNLIILFSVLAVLMLFVGAFAFAYTHSAAYRIGKGFAKLAKDAEALKNPMYEKLGTEELGRMLLTEGYQADAKLDVTFDTFLGEMTLGVDTDFAKDMKQKKLSSSTVLSMMRYEFLHLDAYADENNVCFSMPELFVEDFYLENKNVLRQYNHSMWADGSLFGEAQGDDFSIDLFSSPWYLTDEEGAAEAFWKRYDTEINLCRLSMEMERAGDGIYRVSVDSFYFNTLIWQMMIDWLDDNMDSSVAFREDILGFSNYFIREGDQEKISILLELDKRNRIESIRLEEPISLGRGTVRIDGDIYFLGGENSLEKMQGRITFDDKNSETYREHEIIWQIVRSLEQGEYQMESEAKYSVLKDDRKHTIKMEGDFSYDGPKNSFQAKALLNRQDTEFVWEASGDFSHIRKGEGFDLELDEVKCLTDGEQTMLVSGEIDLVPLSRRVEEIAKPKTAVFSLGEEEWFKILGKIDQAYGYLWEMAEDYLW